MGVLFGIDDVAAWPRCSRAVIGGRIDHGSTARHGGSLTARLMTPSNRVSVALLALALLSGCGRWHVVTAQAARSGRVDLGRERIRVTYPPRTIVLRYPRGAGSYASGIDARGDILTLDLDAVRRPPWSIRPRERFAARPKTAHDLALIRYTGEG